MLKGKNALITGSTSGIGLAVAMQLAAKGCNIMLNGFGNIDDINKLKDNIKEQYKIKVSYSNADMTKSDQIKNMIEETINSFGSIDILVNNAGIQFVSPIEEFPEEKWNAIISINLSSSFHTIKNSLPSMKKNSFGRIINIASAHGLVGSTGKAAYVAAKHGIMGLSKVVALENAQINITCNSICPGWVKTPLVDKQIEDKAKAHNITIEEATKDLLIEKQPSLKFVSPDEIGELVCFLASDSGKSITGTSISVDGGWTAR